MYPDNLRYTREHEWVSVSNDEATVGVTFFAQKELGDVVFVELPDVGRTIAAGEEFGTIESVKAVSEVYAPIAGEVIEINRDLESHPEMINEDPYGKGWMLKIRLKDPAEIASLMDAAAYTDLVGESGE
jgi:glycine cleavage system H protein